jgi:hypothetical protein
MHLGWTQLKGKVEGHTLDILRMNEDTLFCMDKINFFSTQTRLEMRISIGDKVPLQIKPAKDDQL